MFLFTHLCLLQFWGNGFIKYKRKYMLSLYSKLMYTELKRTNSVVLLARLRVANLDNEYNLKHDVQFIYVPYIIFGCTEYNPHDYMFQGLSALVCAGPARTRAGCRSTRTCGPCPTCWSPPALLSSSSRFSTCSSTSSSGGRDSRSSLQVSTSHGQGEVIDGLF